MSPRTEQEVACELKKVADAAIMNSTITCQPLRLGEELQALMDRVTLPEFRAEVRHLRDGNLHVALIPVGVK